MYKKEAVAKFIKHKLMLGFNRVYDKELRAAVEVIDVSENNENIYIALGDGEIVPVSIDYFIKNCHF